MLEFAETPTRLLAKGTMPIRWRCTLCGECCKRYVPLVLPEDVQRIQDSLQRLPSTFVAFYGLSDFHDGSIDPNDERFFVTKHGLRAMGLVRVGLPDDDVGCVFLKNNLCSIHTIKPLVCNQYPFRPTDYDDIGKPFTLVENHCFGNNATDETVDEAPLRRNYTVFQERQDEFLQRVREWNADPRSSEKEVEDFLLFVGLQWS